MLSRHGGTFELSHRMRPGQEPGRGWLLGLGRYSGEELEWFRIFTLAPRPKRAWDRAAAVLRRRRVSPRGRSARCSTPTTWSIGCQSPRGPVELAMSRESLTGFQAWLESRPPGTDWSR